MHTNVNEWAYEHNVKVIKLHLGCGSNYLTTWCNIDAYPVADSDTHRGTSLVKPDIWADIMNIPASDQSVDIILTHHVVEHFYRHQSINLYREFMRILKPGGTIVTEMPDLSRILTLLRFLPIRPSYPKEMKANRDMILAQLYGASWEENDHFYPYHKYVWRRDEFCLILKQLGYNIVLATGATSTHVPFRDMAVICQKPFQGESKNELSGHSIEMLKSYGSHIARFKKQLKSVLNIVLR